MTDSRAVERWVRLLFLALLLANVALYAYGYASRQQADAADRLRQLQINPEKIRLARMATAPTPSQTQPAAAPPPAIPAACLEWGVFAGPDVARADEALAKLGLPDAQLQRTVADTGGYWVYIPPLKTRADVGKSVSALKEAGIADFFVVRGQGQWHNAISLGIFKSEDAAKAFLATVAGKGIKAATVGRRKDFLKQIVYFLREPTQDTVSRLAELQREFPGSEVKAVTCPAGDVSSNP